MSTIEGVSQKLEAGRKRLAAMERKVQAGELPPPKDLVDALAEARGVERDLAAQLKATPHDEELRGVWLSSVGLCEALAGFSLYLARQHGPQYLIT